MQYSREGTLLQLVLHLNILLNIQKHSVSLYKYNVLLLGGNVLFITDAFFGMN